jgi:DNA-binding LacI/PurR family transcriptional regulator
MYVCLYLSPKVRERINLAIGEFGYKSNLVNLGRRVKEKRVELKPELIFRASCGAPLSMSLPRSMERM